MKEQQNYLVEYVFNNSKFVFSNSVIVNATNEDKAKEQALTALSECYGSKMLKRFTLKQPVVL